MTRNTPSKSKQKLSPAMQVTVIVAIIGCAGTILGAIVSGMFMYMTTRAQIDRPIAFTQTAQSQPTTAPPPTQQVITFDWKTILSIDPGAVCAAWYTPDYLFAGSDKFSWVRDNFVSSYTDGKLMHAPRFLSNWYGNLQPTLTITSSPNNKDWISLSQDLTISVRYIDNAPLTSEIIQLSGCGAGGEYRYFSTVPLSTDYAEYDVLSSSTDADFYTLQPGEFEIFILEFECKSPGLYSLQVDIPIKFQGKDEVISYTGFAGVNCPNRLYYNHFFGEIYEVEQYEWIGNGYQKTGP